ncbi:adenosine kinase [Malassezia vespertilionis]|uniref:Adenosine kinase n=1 Tax=Malassezia vespertilionis TaxID=2020962 RepID=A0A2N1JCB7_9BASI|nr:adenosine kinase [Malassezia vespertilionis]PKI84185.1 Ado1p [Malassezia vespertilionis]WFD06689.1 adenosine kinase [Malassezia vespertilionis]
MVQTSNLKLLAMGNPLLDMAIRDGEEMLKKYNLKPNDAVLASSEQMGIYKDIVEGYQVTYVAGGAAQNTARCAQYVLPEGSTAYLGCVGKDDLAQQLRAANDREGVESIYQIDENTPTGSCAVVITGHNRSLCTNLGAAEKFSKSHLDTPDAKAAIEAAKFFYLGGFFLTHGVESAVALAKHAKEHNKPFAFNLSAPFIPQFFKAQVDEVLPYAQLVICNETEAEAYAEAANLNTNDLGEIALAIANAQSVISTPRTVLITHGSKATIRGVQGESSAHVHEVPKINPADIVDTNGAGDAFAGGVLGTLLLNKSIEQAVDVGHRLGGMCVGEVGPVLKFPKENVL